METPPRELADGFTPRISASAPTLTFRSAVAAAFRHWRLLLSILILGVGATATYVLSLPDEFESQLKLMLSHERADPVMSMNNTSSSTLRGVSPEEVNSEIELLRSHELLEGVALKLGLHHEQNDGAEKRWWPLSWGEQKPLEEDERLATIAAKLRKKIEVRPVKDSNIITLSYVSNEPRLSAKLLTTLTDLYLVKHLEIHRPQGAFEFFRLETEDHKSKLRQAEEALREFRRRYGTSANGSVRDRVIQTALDLEGQYRDTRSAVASTQERLRMLQLELARTPQRMTTQVRASPRVIEELESTLAKLELKRSELLAVYQPGYALVGETEEQIRKTREAIAYARDNAPEERTTDVNPMFSWLVTEVSRTKTELSSLSVTLNTTEDDLKGTRAEISHTEQIQVHGRELIRAVEVAEENYRIYLRKQEEARIADALDRQRIANVAVAQSATPALVATGPPRGLMAFVGLMLSLLGSVGAVVIAEWIDPTFRTPEEVEWHLQIPVLASIPKQLE